MDALGSPGPQRGLPMPEAAPRGAARRRNILFITTDQQRYDSLGCNGGTVARTPVVDRLAAEGINYRRAYNQNTVCMPARSTMLTGQYVRTHGVVANGIPLPVDAPSVAQYLHDVAGYRTALLGKAHFEPGFDPKNQFEENARVARGDTGPWRGFERSEQAMHAAAWGDHPDRPLRALAQEAPPRAPAQLRRAAPGRAGRRHRRAGDQEQPDPARVVPHRLGGRPDRRLAQLAGRRRALVLLDVVPRPAPPVGPAGLRARPRALAGPRPAARAPRLRRGGPRRPGAQARPLARLLGRPLPQHGGRAGGVRPLEADPRPDPRDQRQGPRDERADRRGLRPRAADHRAAGLAGRHRRHLHHRPRRDAG